MLNPYQNPFFYGHPVTGVSFTGRERELDALVARMRGHINVVVSSPRRYGKTSLSSSGQKRSSRPPGFRRPSSAPTCSSAGT